MRMRAPPDGEMQILSWGVWAAFRVCVSTGLQVTLTTQLVQGPHCEAYKILRN